MCGKGAEPHHWRRGADGGTGLKPSDCFCIPLCHRHHRQVHDKGHDWFAGEYNVDPWRMIAGLMRDYWIERERHE